MSQIRAVEREYEAMRFSATTTRKQLQRDPTVLTGDLAVSHFHEASQNLEGTYLVRVFAEFEVGARDFYQTVKDTNPRTYDLIESLASRCRIPDTQRMTAHQVRDYRNLLVHERNMSTDPVPISIARSHLCKFFRFLPFDW